MPYQVVQQFEEEIAKYAGAKYAVAVDSCTNALFLCCKYLKINQAIIPSRTYCSVPCAIINAGATIDFEDIQWRQYYQIKPHNIYDAAGCFYRNMYIEQSYFCISFSSTKLINIGKGGMILTDDEESVKWFKMARYMGRHEVALDEDILEIIGWNMYMTPEQAARGLLLMSNVKDYNEPHHREIYPDLSVYKMYKNANRS